MKATLFADGGSRGNPGPGAYGAVLIDENGGILREIGAFLGTTTNNVAEWSGLVAGLEGALELGVDAIVVRLDSELVVRQLDGRYRVKQPHLVPLYNRARSLLRRFAHAEIGHVPRRENKVADALVNRILDAHAPA
ncbi:MAG: ribonuclease HI family protein [Candidatus Eremiobacteraeota bacterium]|nr:ribonuclease HI family protein [Candidatus Eremiobacteraeota bacterium]